MTAVALKGWFNIIEQKQLLNISKSYSLNTEPGVE